MTTNERPFHQRDHLAYRYVLTIRIAADKQKVVKYEVLNPKCITMGELYGEFSELTQEWHDGLASTIMRRAVADEGEHRRYKHGVSPSPPLFCVPRLP